jgi:hypothetical protein
MNDVRYSGWRKSSRSNDSGNCVEVGSAPSRHVIGVRDTKQHGHGPMLQFTVPAWEAFVAAVRSRDPLA